MAPHEPTGRPPRTPLSLGEMSSHQWRDLAALSGELGVVSMAVDYAFRGRRRGVEMLKREMGRSARGAPPEDVRPTDWRQALAACEVALTASLMAATSPGERSRAFFCVVGETDAFAVASPLRLPEFFAVGAQPRLTELALADPASGVRGVIGVTRARLTAAEFWGPYARAEWAIPIEEDRDGRRLQGPGHGGPQRAVVQRDRLARRRDQTHERAIADAAGELAARAAARGWTVAVVGGDMREVGRVIRPLSSAGVPAIPHGRHVDSPAERMAALDAADAEGDRLARSRLAASGPRVVRDLAAIGNTIAEGRATELFLGARPLTAGRETGRVESDSSRACDEIVRAAFAAGVPVTPIHDGSALGLDPGVLVAGVASARARGSDGGAGVPRPAATGDGRPELGAIS